MPIVKQEEEEEEEEEVCDAVTRYLPIVVEQVTLLNLCD
jgi:hypothetical protein